MIQGFRAFESTTALEPYLEEIDITSLQYRWGRFLIKF
jgi:hypothetical protein